MCAHTKHTRSNLWWPAILSVGLIIVLSCGKKTDTEATAEMENLSDDSLCILAAQKIASAHAQDLKSELVSALAQGGPAGAITVCRTKLPEIAFKHAEPGVLSVKRVSDRNRNPKNAAGPEALGLLAQFRDSTGMPRDYVRFWHSDGDRKLFTYYQPIFAGPVCLNCHGAIESLEPEVRETLRVNYPDDKATGYQVDDLRGLFVVKIVFPEGRKMALNIIAEGT